MDAKFKIGGLEALDLLVALIFGAVMNLLFGGTALEVPLVIGGPALIMGVLYFGKKGKPDQFLAHWIRFHLEPGFFSAGTDPKLTLKIRRSIYE